MKTNESLEFLVIVLSCCWIMKSKFGRKQLFTMYDSLGLGLSSALFLIGKDQVQK